MTAIRKKLNTQTGASILLALMLFLICGFVAAVTLGSASSNAHKYEHQRKEQQEYLAVSSAAALLKEVIEGTSFSGTEESKLYICRGDAETGDDYHEDAFEKVLKLTVMHNGKLLNSTDERILSLIEDGVYAIFISQTVNVDKDTSRLTRLDDKGAMGWKNSFDIEVDSGYPVNKIHADVTIASDYTMNILLSIPITAGTTDNGYTITLTFSGAGQPQNTDSEPELTCDHERTEKQPDDVTGSKTERVTHHYINSHHKRKTTITYSNGVIEQGDLTK